MERRVVPVVRDCEARLVPTGDKVSIPAGAFVTLTQTLGGTYTIVHLGNMARIAGSDGDALGFEPEVLQFPESDATPTEEYVWFALRSVFDPEIPVNIADLGLIYAVALRDSTAHIKMTLTAPGCGMGPVLIAEVEERVKQAPGIDEVEIELVFEPPWSREMMSEEAQLELGLF
ncbi:MAG: putative Fe-S cluster assembly protein SufT [Pseudomonadales bacterium]|jgi:probable FeS assembly SUF system protein SufT|nr:putative Fe-S cluster assembly protein SufT [Pseudomonadales bacterium]